MAAVSVSRERIPQNYCNNQFASDEDNEADTDSISDTDIDNDIK